MHSLGLVLLLLRIEIELICLAYFHEKVFFLLQLKSFCLNLFFECDLFIHWEMFFDGLYYWIRS